MPSSSVEAAAGVVTAGATVGAAAAVEATPVVAAAAAVVAVVVVVLGASWKYGDDAEAGGAPMEPQNASDSSGRRGAASWRPRLTSARAAGTEEEFAEESAEIFGRCVAGCCCALRFSSTGSR